jgi:predicted enzyme related to lactoylglutathione lyase
VFAIIARARHPLIKYPHERSHLFRDPCGADDPVRAAALCSQVFGWKFVRDESLPRDYWRIETEGVSGGLLKRLSRRPPLQSGTNAFVCSIEVADFHATAKKILGNDGLVAQEKLAVPGRCWQGFFLDPDENVFGRFQAGENAS